MEETFQPALPHFQNRIAAIEAFELSTLGLLLWILAALVSTQTAESNLGDLIVFFFFTEGILLGSWAIYNAYIRLARAGGRFVDYGLWVGTFFLTGSYTL